MSSPVLAIANRAEIAVRIARTARVRGWTPVALLGEPDWYGYAAREIDNVVRLNAGEEFNAPAVVRAAREAGASALHPGYGFLSERPELSRLCAEAGITFVGPTPDTLRMAGDKIVTREIARRRSIPVLPGSAALDLDNPDSWPGVAAEIGYPVIAKVAGAGGGRGLRVARTSDELAAAIQSSVNEAGGSGAEAEVFLEHYLEGARHVEIQVAGDGKRATVLGDRDCSLQRRHQKIVEEAPAPGLDDDLRSAIHDAARGLAEEIGLINLATVEFLVADDGRFYFMEINPRLQVEHTVTEEVTGFDLVALQLDLAAGGELPDPVAPEGHAIQARIYAEDPFQQFLPSPGHILKLDFPNRYAIPGARVRVDAGYASRDDVPGSYDPMIAKLIVRAGDRDAAVAGLVEALRAMDVAGVATNRPWLITALEEGAAFQTNTHDLTTAANIQLELNPPPPDVLHGVAMLAYAAGERSGSAWDSSGPFRIVAPATVTFHGDESGGWQRTVVLHQGKQPESAHPATIVPIENGWEAATPEGRWIVRSGPQPSVGAVGASGDGEVRAPMPGRVLQVPVKPGQQVQEGETVAVLEAMKIEMSLAAPFTGTVATVAVNQGDLVGLRQVVVSIERSNDESSNGDIT